VRKLLPALALVVISTTIVLAPAPVALASEARPNFVVIVTDDQSIGTLQKMENLRALGGTRFGQGIISNPLCCPSRATILTGNYSHTTGTYTNADGGPDQAVWGGYPSFRDHGNQPNTVTASLDSAGYETGLFGKYLNWFTKADAYADGIPEGWDHWHGFVGNNPRYYDYDWVDWDRGGELTDRHYGTQPEAYSTNVSGQYALDFINEAKQGTEPFFAYYAPYGPHGPVTPAPGDGGTNAPPGVNFKTGAFDERDVSDKPAYIRNMPRVSEAQEATWENKYDDQYAALESIDRWIGRFSEAAPPNTVFVFISDNGQAWGDHRWSYKLVPYERSIHVPFIISAPGAPAQATDSLVTNADVTPTILEMAGVTLPNDASRDGRSLAGIVSGSAPLDYAVHPEGILLEHIDYPTVHNVPSYCGVRDVSWKYVAYQGGFEELYNLDADPNEMQNVAKRRPAVLDKYRLVAQTLCVPMPPGMTPDYFGRKLGG
jgi:N-acetylglucosamine-6-sulfatase